MKPCEYLFQWAVSHAVCNEVVVVGMFSTVPSPVATFGNSTSLDVVGSNMSPHRAGLWQSNSTSESHGGFKKKWWYRTTMGFPTKNDHFGVFWGVKPLRKHTYLNVINENALSPYNWIALNWWPLIITTSKKRPDKKKGGHLLEHALLMSFGSLQAFFLLEKNAQTLFGSIFLFFFAPQSERRKVRFRVPASQMEP